MKLIDLISLIDDNSNVNVWKDGEIIATYDGKDSIPEELNKEEVRGISAGHFLISIEL